MVPLHLSGNTTEQQERLLHDFLADAALGAGRNALEQLDRQTAQSVLDSGKELRKEVVERIVALIQKHTASDKFKSEETISDRIYPPTYRVRPIEAQVTELRKLFPTLGSCHERMARRPLPEGAEAWFAIPRWQTLAPNYSEAEDRILEAVAKKRSSPTASSARSATSFCGRASDRSWPRRSLPSNRKGMTCSL